MVLDSIQKHHLKQFIESVRDRRARHTELITIYAPAGYDLNIIINQLNDEAGTATNIKSTTTRNNVIEALQKMIVHLRSVGKTPANGLCAFSGNVSEKEGGRDFLVTSIEPPMAINQKLYRCDKDFKTELLEDMLVDDTCYGFVVMDNREALLAVLKGKKMQVLTETTSGVPGKFRAGGQSAPRFQRIHENMCNEFYNKISSLMVDQFLPLWDNLKGIIVGGPGIPKVKMMDCAGMNGQIKDKILALKDTSYTGEFGLQELFDLSGDVLAAEEVAQEKKTMAKFFQLLRDEEKKVTYGIAKTRELLEMGICETVLVSEKLDAKIFDEFESIAEQFKSKIMLVSTDTREGMQLKDLGGAAAILRFAYED